MAHPPILCPDCSTLTINIPDAGTARRAETEHLTLREIQDGAGKGCAVCTTLARTVLGSSLLGSALLPRLASSLKIEGVHHKAKVVLSGRDEPLLADVVVGAAVLMKDLRVYTLAGDPLANVIRSRPFTSGSASPEAFGLVKAWIRNCDDHHSECMKPEDTELPTRLLDVAFSGSDKNKNDDVRLHIPRDHGQETGRYIALSYCWGRTRSLQTTTATITQHKNRIPYRALPDTIEDAGEDAAAKADWERESARMHRVYGGSYVTLSASGSSNCQLGMFLPRTPSRVPVFQFQALHGSTRGRIYLESRKRVWQVSEEEPIDYRAWTLQERLLSPRVIKYGAEAVYWECQSVQHSEFEDAIPMTKSLKHYRLPQRLGVDDWIDVVEDYSTRRLTVSNDRFIALSGIAHRFQQDLQLEYIAGLWHSEKDHTVLPRSLLWTCGIENAEHETDWMSSARYNGPSWSWATSKCPVVYNSPPVLPVTGYDSRRQRDFRHWQAQIISIHVATNVLNPFAYVEDARLTIRAPRKQIPGLCRSSLGDYYIFDPLHGPEAKIGTVSLDAMDSIPCIYDESSKLKDRIEHGKDGAILPSCLHIVDVGMGRLELSDAIAGVPYGLLITPCHTQPPYYYWRRVGLFCLYDTTRYAPLDAEWLDDVSPAEIVLV
ncbi:hypothetical protein BJY00DRAFT_319421 [Aspergillus carlsbadensis]|nr:hypothetical protein BJY00DRAFT_319421 [Aspergillus carlsbadensis]